MGTLLVVVLLLGGVAYLFFRPGEDRRPSKASSKAPKGHSSALPDWLQERWAMLKDHRSGSGVFPPWYFDPMTEFQARRLAEDGVRTSLSLTKGQASDLIGLGEPADEDDIEVLRFFKRPLRAMSQTRARHEVAVLFQDEGNRRAWEERPATDGQREFFRFFGLPVSAGLLKREADSVIAGKVSAAEAAGDPLIDRWRILAQVFDDFADADFRDGYDMRKPSMPTVRKAVEALAAEIGWESVDSDAVAERLLETNPSLQK